MAEIILSDSRSQQLDFAPVIFDESGSDFVRAPRVLTEPDLKKFEGIWRSVRHMDVQTVERKDNVLFNNKSRGIVISRDTLFFDRKWVSSKPCRITILNWQDTLSYYKVAAPDLSAVSLNSLGGTYTSDEADAIYFVEIINNVVWINNKPFPAFKLSPSFKDGFFSADGDLYEFRRDKKGKVTRLLVSTGRATHVSFNKVK